MAKSKRKPKSTAKLLEEAAVLVQKLVRMKAADDSGICKCTTCPKHYHWKDMDGGHFISRRYKATKITEEQINPQCVGCNRFPDYFTHENYKAFMVDRHGADYVEWLERESQKVKKWTAFEIEELARHFREQIAEQETRLGERHG